MTEQIIFPLGRAVSSPVQGRLDSSFYVGADAKRFWTSVHQTLPLHSEDMLESEPKTESNPTIPSSLELRDAGVELTSIATYGITPIENSKVASRHDSESSEREMESVTFGLAGSGQELEHPGVTQTSVNSSIWMKLGEGPIGEVSTVAPAHHDPSTFNDTGSNADLGAYRKENSLTEGESKVLVPAKENSSHFQNEFNGNLIYQHSMIGALQAHQENQTKSPGDSVSERVEGGVPESHFKINTFQWLEEVKGFHKYSDIKEMNSGDTLNSETAIDLKSVFLTSAGVSKINSKNDQGAITRSLEENAPRPISENRFTLNNQGQEISTVFSRVNFEKEPEGLGPKEVMPMLGNANVNPSISHSRVSYHFSSNILPHALAHTSESLSADRSFDFNVRSNNADLDINFNATNKDVFDILSRYQSDLRQFLKSYGVDEFSLKFDLSDGQTSSEFQERGIDQDDQKIIVVDLEESGRIENFLITGLDRRI
jgi:hypothetical protein